MAVAGDIVVNVVANTRAFTKGMADAQRTTSRTSATISTSMGSIAKAVAASTVAVRAMNFALDSLSTAFRTTISEAVRAEKALLSFEILAGGA